MATRWGIVGAGKICNDFTVAVGILPKSEHKIVAVAARDLSRAKEFANIHEIENAYGSYEELANDKNVEVVYVGTLNSSHVKHSEMMLKAGKHVLCEKPLAVNLKEAKKIIDLARNKGLFLMEGMWSRFFPAYETLRNELCKETIGEVKQVVASIGVKLSHLDRLAKKKLDGGSTLTNGVYLTQLACLVFDHEKPSSIKAVGHLNQDGVDLSMSASLTYANKRTATVVSNVEVVMPNEAWIIGTRGKIKLPDLWCPTKVILPGGGVRQVTLPQTKVSVNYMNSCGLMYEADEVRNCLTRGLKESPKMTHEHSLVIMEIQDEIRRQIGVVYDEDD